jgi:hypothetical protein
MKPEVVDEAKDIGRTLDDHRAVAQVERRTAARNLIRSGLARSQAKGFTRHMTDSVFDRYAIDDAASKKEAAEKYAAHMETQRPTQKVINLR